MISFQDKTPFVPLTILFGSGADTCFSSRLKSGAAFSEVLLTNQYATERKNLLGADKSGFQLVYPRSTKVFLNTIYTHQEEAKKVLEADIVDRCVYYYEHRDNALRKDIENWCVEWYGLLKDVLSDKEQAVRKFFLEKAVFFDALDAKFNSLRNPDLNSNAKRVINAYAAVFVLMLRDLYHITDDFDWKYKSVIDLLQKPYDVIKDEAHHESYYSIVNESRISCNIATTNYTNIAQVVTSQEVAYLHGKLNWFEDYKNMAVYDCCDSLERILAERNAETIFPFILIPSGVKPLICQKEIEEFHKFITMLKNSTQLCVIGYRFNSEDNHINSIIAEWLRHPDHQLICFNHNNSITFDHLPFSSLVKTVKNYPESTLPTEKVLNIIIDDATAIPAFKKFIEEQVL